MGPKKLHLVVFSKGPNWVWVLHILSLFGGGSFFDFVGTASNGYSCPIRRLPWRETTNLCDTKVGHPSAYLAILEGIPILLSQKMDLDPFPYEDCSSANAQGLQSWSCHHVLLRRLTTTDRIGIRDAPILVGLLALGVFHLLKPPKPNTMIPIGDSL